MIRDPYRIDLSIDAAALCLAVVFLMGLAVGGFVGALWVLR